MKNKQIIIAAVVALIIGGGLGYWAGTAYGHAGRGSFTAGSFMGGAGTTEARGARFTMGGGLLTGSVASVGNGSMTLTTSDGSSHVVLLSASTTIAKSVAGSATDLTAGTNVMVTGTQNSDGSISANFITLRPAGSPAPGTMGR